MKPPTITTFIACKNHGKFLQEAIDSIMAQTFKPTEFILIDDGSTDHSYEVMLRNAARDKRFIVIKHSMSIGNIRSYNVGIERATGDYIHLMASDDKMLDKFFYEDACMQLMMDHELGFVSTGLQHMDEEGRMLPTQALPPVEGKLRPKECLALMLARGNFINGGGTLVAAPIQKSFYYDLNFPYTADMLNWVRILKYGKAAYFFGRPSYLYRQHPNTLSKMKPALMTERENCQHHLVEALNAV